jgi:hypothetical protein
MRSWRLLVCGSLSLAACGSQTGTAADGGGGASVSGTLAGKPFTATDLDCYDCLGGVNFVTMRDGAGSLCSGNAVEANSSVILFNFGTANPGSTYGAPVDYLVFDGACNQVTHESGTGTVTVSAASASSVSGTFSVTLDAGTVSGDFVAPICAQPNEACH